MTVIINFIGDDGMDNQFWLSLILCSSFSLVNLIAVIMKFKTTLEPIQVRVARFLLFILLIFFSIILVKVTRSAWKIDFPLHNDFGLENGKIYQIVYGMLPLMGTAVLTLNSFTLVFVHCCYYIWQVWKDKNTDRELEFRFSNFKVTVYSIFLSCLILFMALPYYLLDIFQTILGISFFVLFIERTRPLFNSKKSRNSNKKLL